MRIRSIKPEFWSSEDVASLDWHARLVFLGLWSYVDDNGVGRDNEKLIVADIFPLDDDPSEALARVSRGLRQLSAANLIVRYDAEDGKNYLFVTGWKHQRIDRPNKARYPLPTAETCENVAKREGLARVSRQTSEGVAPGTGEQGNRGTGEELPPSAEPRMRSKYPAEFVEFWSNYPRKVGKDDALKAWLQARRKTAPTEIVAGVQRMAADPNLPEERFIPHPATWLRRGGWNDAPYPPRNGSRASPSTTDQRVQAGLDLAQKYAEQERRLEIGA